MQSIDNVLKLRKGLKPDDPNPDIFDILWAKKLSNVAKDYTITGNPLSFLAKKAQTAKSTKVTLEPVQDLHGYDNPWPAGCGKNKMPDTNWTIGKYYNSEGEIVDSTNAMLSDFAEVYADTVYTLSGVNIHVSQAGSNRTIVIVVFFDDNKNFLDRFYINDLENFYTFTTPQNCAFIRASMGDLATEVQLESGSTPTSYAPYSNICPISGRSSVEIKGCGKNLFFSIIYGANVNLSGEIVSNGTYSLAVAEVQKGQRYLNSIDGNAEVGIRGYFTDMPIKGSVTYNGSRYTSGNSFTSPIDGYVCIRISISETKYQLELSPVGTTASPYEAYQSSNDVTITFGETVYGGTLDVETGVLTMDKAKFDLSQKTWIKVNERFNTSTTVTNAPSGNNAKCLCSKYKSNAGASTRTSDFSICFANNGYVYAYDTSFDGDETAFKESMANVDFVYELAQPTTIQLTPSQIQILKGQNTIWIEDEGATIALTYKN